MYESVRDLVHAEFVHRLTALEPLYLRRIPLSRPTGRPILHRPVIVAHRRASAGHRLCEFQKSWHRPGVVRRADARTASAGGVKYV